MSTTGDVKVTEGSGKNVATYTISEDSETKSLQRIVLCDPTGAEIGSVLSTAALSTADSFVEVHQPATVVSLAPTLDTAAYTAGDVLFATVAVTMARANDKAVNIQSLTAIDKSKQHPALTLFYYQTNVTSAAANAANALSDADAINCLGFIRIAAADWIDLANNSFACYKGSTAPNLILQPATGTTTVYIVGILDAGTPTFALGDLMFKHGVVQS